MNPSPRDAIKIVKVDAIPFRLPLKHPLSFATGKYSAMDYVLVRIESASGQAGIAEAPARSMVYGESVASIVSAVRDWFAPALEGLEHHRIEEAALRLESYEGNQCAKGAIDLALHDLVAKEAGVPLRRLLGGYTDSVEICHCIIKLSEPEAVAAEAAEMVERHGFRWLKLKGGVDSVRDTRMLAAVRRAVGPSVRLSVDLNHGYPAHVAQKVLPGWREFELDWIEEPCPGQDVLGRARAAAAAGIPFMVDESAPTPFTVMEEIRRGVCSVVSIKAARTGITSSRKILALCEQGGMRPILGGQGDSLIGAFGAAQLGAGQRSLAVGCAELSFFLDLEDGIAAADPVLRDGRLELSEQPGIGLTIDEDALERCRIDR